MVHHDGEEIGQRFAISNLQAKDQANLTLEEINKGPRLKDDVAFVLLIVIFPHMVTMFNKIDNLLGLDAILNGESTGLGNHASQQHGINIGKVIVEEIIDRSNKVRWNLPLDATYVYYKVALILYKIDIYTTIWANKLFPLRICHN